MKLLRVGEAGAERPAVMLDDGTIIDVSSAVGEIDGAWLEGGGVDRLAKALGERHRSLPERRARHADRPAGGAARPHHRHRPQLR